MPLVVKFADKSLKQTHGDNSPRAFAYLPELLQRYQHLNEIDEKFYSVKDDDDAADHVDYTKNFVREFCTEQREQGGNT